VALVVSSIATQCFAKSILDSRDIFPGRRGTGTQSLLHDSLIVLPCRERYALRGNEEHTPLQLESFGDVKMEGSLLINAMSAQFQVVLLCCDDMPLEALVQ
jgi:hypothetical protein